jgi:hypothetical protein
MKEINKIADKKVDLLKYRDLVLATIDYYLESKIFVTNSAEFNSAEYYNKLKRQTEEHFQAGRLTKLKQWFRDLTEMQVECRDLKFNKYLQDKTKIDIDIFTSYFQRIDKIIEKGKISTDNQFYEINNLVDQLCQVEPIEINRIENLNKLLSEYEQKKSRKK